MTQRTQCRGQLSIRQRCADERGVALVLVLAMLTIMSLLGAMVLSTSTSEIGISSNYRTSREAFFAAERAVDYSMGNNAIITATGSVLLSNECGSAKSTHHQNLEVNNGGVVTTIDCNVVVDDSDPTNPLNGNRVINIGAGELPVRLKAKYGSSFGANYYLITVTGARVDGDGNVLSTARIETQRVRLFPNSDDSQTGSSKEG